MLLDQIRLHNVKKELFGEEEKVWGRKCMLMWSSQKMVFPRICIIFFGHSISKPLFHVLSSPSFYELYGGHYLPLSGKAENASYLFLFLHSPFGSLAAGVQVYNLDSKDNCPRVTGNAHHQGCVPGRGSSYRKIAFLGQRWYCISESTLCSFLFVGIQQWR